MKRWLLAAPVLLGSVGCLTGPCENTVVRRIPSPDGALEAVLYERSCGATTDFSTQVTVLATGEALTDRSEPVFVADRNHGQAPAARWGGPPAEVVWPEADRLVVRYAVEARVFREHTYLKVGTRAVTIRYERAL